MSIFPGQYCPRCGSFVHAGRGFCVMCGHGKIAGGQVSRANTEQGSGMTASPVSPAPHIECDDPEFDESLDCQICGQGIDQHSKESIAKRLRNPNAPPAPDDDLVKAARQAQEEGRYAERYRTVNANRLCGKLADRIEALERRVANLERENKRLLDGCVFHERRAELLRKALREIRRGRMPEDYGRFDVCCARLTGIAATVLEDTEAK